MPATVVIGTQWGDEGKGKIVDLLAAEVDVVARFHGGNNAGHTLVVEGEKTVLNLIPSGILHPGKICMMGPGMVIDPEVLEREIAALKARGHLGDPARLRVSEQAHLIMPYHRQIDLARERHRGADNIGTTGRGIGPAYEDKVTREGIRVADLFDEEAFPDHLMRVAAAKSRYLELVLGEPPLDTTALAEECGRWRAQLRPYVADTAHELRVALADGKRVLLEGAQGVMLDVDHGTYPFVTSSSVVAGSAAVGSGLPPRALSKIVGITKAYTTRVGSGPFPTEETGDLGERLRADGEEYGATTGRPRRCGWFDAVVVRHAVSLSGVDGLALTKIDVLTGIDPLRICIGYELDGRRLDRVPTTARAWERIRPVYDEMPGWTEPLGDVRSLDDLPEAARKYVERLEALAGAPVVILSVGPGREQTMQLAAVV